MKFNISAAKIEAVAQALKPIARPSRFTSEEIFEDFFMSHKEMRRTVNGTHRAGQTHSTTSRQWKPREISVSSSTPVADYEFDQKIRQLNRQLRTIGGGR